mmetsp:Transcript_7766/g.19941  ORF Transcript_7766/g.19941 Transcript_7766/m.19941 type:complete len:247 (-) Transcript_7766:146-886(-)
MRARKPPSSAPLSGSRTRVARMPCTSSPQLSCPSPSASSASRCASASRNWRGIRLGSRRRVSCATCGGRRRPLRRVSSWRKSARASACRSTSASDSTASTSASSRASASSRCAASARTPSATSATSRSAALNSASLTAPSPLASSIACRYSSPASSAGAPSPSMSARKRPRSSMASRPRPEESYCRNSCEKRTPSASMAAWRPLYRAARAATPALSSWSGHTVPSEARDPKRRGHHPLAFSSSSTL